MGKSAEIIKTVEIAAGAAAGAYASTYFGGPAGYDLGGKVPVEPVAALALWLAGTFAFKAKTGDHFVAIGDGVMAGWVAKKASEMALEQKLSSGAASEGYPVGQPYQLGAGAYPYQLGATPYNNPQMVSPLLRAAGLAY